MRNLIRAGRKNQTIRNKAVALVSHLPQKDTIGEIRALFEFVQNEIRYVRDIHNVETIHFPEVILENSQGDCDDKVVALGSLLESVGHPVKIVAVGFRPGVYSHVYLETRFGKNGWLPLDATEPYAMGWKPKNIVERMERYI